MSLQNTKVCTGWMRFRIDRFHCTSLKYFCSYLFYNIYICTEDTGHSTAVAPGKLPFQLHFFPGYFFFEKWNFWEFCMILEYFSLGKIFTGHFTRSWGRLDKFLPFYFRITTSYFEMSGMPWGHAKKKMFFFLQTHTL